MGSFARPDWTQEEITNLQTLCASGKYQFTEIAKLLGRPLRGVMYKCYERGFGNKYIARKYSHDTEFFSRITYESCYWAAIMATDGCISWKRQIPTITWSCAVRDKEHMELFKETIKSTNPISLRSTNCPLSTKDPNKQHPYSSIRIESAYQLVKDLELNFGVTRNKTLRSAPPNLPTLKHKLSYIRGFIDGDGSISHSPQKGFIVIMVCGCNREMIAWIKDVVDSLLIPHIHPAKRPSLISQPKDESCYYFHLRGFRAAVLFELLRRLSVPNLSRKWDNPRVLEEVDHWKQQTDRWPPESFFSNLLNDCESTVSTT